MKAFPKIKLNYKLVRFVFNFFETPVEELLFTNSRLVEYSHVLKVLFSKNPGKVLDVGCTYRFNYIAPTLASLNWNVFGIDIRQFKYKHANFKFIQGDIREPQFPDSYFDYIYSVSTVEHIGIKNEAYNIRDSDGEGDLKAMREMARILKPDGLLVLTTEYGVTAAKEELRVYDKSTLKKLILGWRLIAKTFYAQTKDNSWSQVSEVQADSLREHTHVVVICELSPEK